MPIYEYQCESCSAALEILQKASDPAPAICEKCGKGSMVKQMSLSSFALKGTGWYVTDFRGGNGAPNSASTKSAPENAQSESPSNGNLETKSETSPTTSSTSSPAADSASKT